MKRCAAWLLILLAAACGHACAAADGYWTTNADAYYHLDPACTGAARMFPISEEAAVYFDKQACPQCIGEKWEPYFTGDFGEWDYDYIEPWALTNGFVPNEQRWEKRYQAGSADTSKLDNAFAKYGMQDDYCGRYYGASGDLVIALKNPTIERAEQYAEICGGDIWVIEADYSLAELAEAQQAMYGLIDQWNAGHENQVRMMMSSYGNGKDYVEAILNGTGVVDFMAEMGAGLHPAVQVDYPMLDARESVAVPPVQPGSHAGEGYALSMMQDSYPVGTPSLGLKLEVDGGRLMDYEFSCTLYKYVDASTLAHLQAEWKNESYGASIFKYASEGFVQLASDFTAPVFGTANGTLYCEWSTAGWNRLGEGLYRLDTGMGMVEFIVHEGADALKMPEPEPKPAFTVPEHALSGADASAYISDEDPNRAGTDAILAGDRLYWIHTVRESDVEMGNVMSVILSAPAANPAEVSVVYGPVAGWISDLVDCGGVIFIESQDSGVVLKRISYDGSVQDELARRSGYAGNLMLIGGKLYYCDDQCIYCYDMEKDAQNVIFKTEDAIYNGFAAYEGKLAVSVVNWSDTDKSAVYAVDLETKEARRIKRGKHFFYMVRDGRLYTAEDFDGQGFNSYLKFADGLYVSYWDDAAGVMQYALLGWDGSRMDKLPGGLFELGGRLYIRDGHGNIALADLSKYT